MGSIDWTEADKKLGTVPDRQIAEAYGVVTQTVYMRRKQLGIAAYKGSSKGGANAPRSPKRPPVPDEEGEEGDCEPEDDAARFLARAEASVPATGSGTTGVTLYVCWAGKLRKRSLVVSLSRKAVQEVFDRAGAFVSFVDVNGVTQAFSTMSIESFRLVGAP